MGLPPATLQAVLPGAAAGAGGAAAFDVTSAGSGAGRGGRVGEPVVPAGAATAPLLGSQELATPLTTPMTQTLTYEQKQEAEWRGEQGRQQEAAARMQMQLLAMRQFEELGDEGQPQEGAGDRGDRAVTAADDDARLVTVDGMICGIVGGGGAASRLPSRLGSDASITLAAAVSPSVGIAGPSFPLGRSIGLSGGSSGGGGSGIGSNADSRVGSRHYSTLVEIMGPDFSRVSAVSGGAGVSVSMHRNIYSSGGPSFMAVAATAGGPTAAEAAAAVAQYGGYRDAQPRDLDDGPMQ
eukprot:XP_001693984.1 predicted protein [Chlamydomonas reinhardtii]